MADDALLRQAWNLYKQGRFSTALESLEPKVFQHREDPDFFRVLGLCCLRLGDWKGGETYLQRSRQIEEPAHRDVLLGLLCVSARRKDFPEAVRLGLELLDRNPDDRVAKKALARLRQALAAPEGTASIDKEALAQWLPRYRKIDPRVSRWLIRFVAGAAIAAGVVAGVFWGINLVRPTSPPTQARALPEGAQLPATGDVIVEAKGFALTLTAEEVKQGWERAQAAFQAYRDSRARYEINRLLLSNAAAPMKERARSLIPFLHEPDFARPDDTSSYQEVRISPPLYEGCTVRWSGVLANLVSGDKKITFDLLLGYQNGQVVEGIVPVELTFAALLKNSQVVEVLGRIVVRDGSWLVQATSLRDLGYRAP